MPLQATSGAASYDAFGGGVPVVANYIEDAFSTYIYTGNGSTQTITNGIDLSTQGGLVWIKRYNDTDGHQLYDTSRGATKFLTSNAVDAETTAATGLTAFTTSGFTLGADVAVNANTGSYISWSWLEKSKFFDIVTFTGNGSARTIAHNLGAVPGAIIIKQVNSTQPWTVYHRSRGNTRYITLNTTAAEVTDSTVWNNTTPTSTVFSVGTSNRTNANAQTYVAYIFAHNAGGFGLTGTDNVISCGSYTGSAAGVTITLGYEAQWVLIKKTSAAGDNWRLLDVIRGMAVAGFNKFTLAPNSSIAEETWSDAASPSATGFTVGGAGLTDNGDTYIYIAIRRGQMKVPTTGSSVFGLSARTGTGANVTVTGGQTADAVFVKNRGSAVASLFSSRLTSIQYLVTSSTAAGVSAGVDILQANPWNVMNGVKVGTTNTITNASANTFINYLFKRAPSFMDVVCYIGTGSATTQAHNLQKVPELMIVKNRSAIEDWPVYPNSATEYLLLNATQGIGSASTLWNNTAPTSSVFSIGTSSFVNTSAATYVAYLFATCAGVSKVGSYTGTGTTLQVNCGFTAGSRFVLIKRTDSTGDWYFWDSARGIVAGNDPYLLLNNTAAQVTGTDYIDTYSAGFEISSTAPAAINANGGTFIFLAIA